MSFLSCCKCEGSRVRRGLLDSITARTHLPLASLLHHPITVRNPRHLAVGAKGEIQQR